jgi:hypothetical protein
MKKRKIKEQLEMIDRHLANAEEYIASNENVESSSQFHLEDWNGKSGHPLWMKNHMIPRTKKARAKMEKALGTIASKEKDKKSEKR